MQGILETSLNRPLFYLKTILTWWIMAVLLGAKNLEQQRYLNTDDFEYITGSGPLPAVPTMRRILHSLGLLADTSAASFCERI